MGRTDYDPYLQDDDSRVPRPAPRPASRRALRTSPWARALLLGGLVSVTSCTFAVQHPAATAGILGGTIGFLTCELPTDFNRHGTCALIGGGAGLLLGGVVLLATLVGGEGNTVLGEPVRAHPGSEPPRVQEPPRVEEPPPEPEPSPPPAPATPPAPAPAPATPPATPSAPAPATAPAPAPAT